MTWLETASRVWGYTHLSAAERQQGLALAAPNRTTSADHPSWKSWALTEIVYREESTLSKLFAISSFMPLVIVIFLSGLASAPCPARRVPALNLLLYLIISVCVNVTLKASIRSQRPPHPAAGMNYTTIHGMPSDHSQFMAGVSVYLVRRWCAVAAPRSQANSASSSSSKAAGRKDRSGVSSTPAPAPVPRVLLTFLGCATLFIGAGRVYNGYHTVGQVLVGWSGGAVLGWVFTSAPAQRLLTWVSETLLLPVMLVCTFWTNAVC